MTTNIERDEILAQVVQKLSDARPNLERSEIERIAAEELDAIADSPVQDFLVVLTERATKKRLKRK